MCGILGHAGSRRLEDHQIQAGIRRLGHRGPDDSGYRSWSVAGTQLQLAHTRLSIIDLSSAGRQPMSWGDDRHHLIYNGEIYNYREIRSELGRQGYQFRTQTDTEVVLVALAHWGVAALPRFRGMFALAYFDRQTRQLLCARDAFGIKPFFYAIDKDGLSFASESQALEKLRQAPFVPDLQQGYNYLVLGRYDDGESSFFQGIRHLRPGCLFTLDLGADTLRPEFRRWWWPSIQARDDLSFRQAAEELRERFVENVRLHLRSDVPLGAALSGGIDSSAVVCAMRKLEPDLPLHTFSFIARGSAVDEEAWIDLVNRHCGAIPHKLTVSPDELASDLDDMIRAQGEPFGSTSIYAQFRIFRLASEAGITVTLDGQGADELLGGYLGYPDRCIHSYLDRREWMRALRFAWHWSRGPGRGLGKAALALGSQLSPRELIPLARKMLGQNPAPDWIRIKALEAAGVRTGFARIDDPGEDAHGRRLAAALRRALTQAGLGSLLRHGDRNSMRFSIESRVPFLTTDLAEFLLSLPENYLVSGTGETKSVFRAAMRGIVPDRVLDRRDKIGFATPEQAWLGQISPQIRTWMEAAEEIPFLHPESCRREVDAMIEGRKPFSWQAWRLINYCSWVRVNAG